MTHSFKLGEYPFVDRDPPTFWQWMALYTSAPIAFYLCINYWESKKPDKTCINDVCHGILRTRVMEIISLKKAKKLSKQMDLTFNDLILGIIS